MLIVDDEQPARERLQRLVAELPGWAVTGACANGTDALALVGKLQPAVVLLDIRMPGMTGIEVARHLGALERAARDRVHDGLRRVRAAGVRVARRRLSAEARAPRAARGRAEARVALELAAAARRSRRPEQPLAARQHVAARVRDELKLIPVKDIRFFRAEQKYVTVRHSRGEDLIDESLRQLEDEFARDFVRVHRSLLVAVAHIEALERTADGYELKLRGEAAALPVSRRQVADLRKRLAGR